MSVTPFPVAAPRAAPEASPVAVLGATTAVTGQAARATPAASSARTLRTLVLAVGPLLSLLLVDLLVARSALTPAEAHIWMVAAAVAWSPLPISIPAVLLDRERDLALQSVWRPVRALLLLPYLALSRRSTVRLATTLSTLSWGLMLFLMGT